MEKVIDVLWVEKQDRQRRLNFTLDCFICYNCLFI